MFENTKCECGHQNHVGTVLCESCGKPLYDDSGQESLEMRYDGIARRSQKDNPLILDRVWNFFSSVKIAIYLILFTLVSSMLGTIYPQENTFINMDPSVFYKQNYGSLGNIYYLLGLSHTYESWWFMLLLFTIGTSLVICSLDRVLPLYRALNKQQIRKHLQFILRQKISYTATLSLPSETTSNGTEQWIEGMAKQLRKQRYRVHTDGSALLAEKYRFSRWGPYVLHIGLIIFLLAVLMRGIPGWHMDQYMGFLEGQTVKIPNTSYYLKNDKFVVDYYTKDEMSKQFQKKDANVPKVYETQAILYRCTSQCDDPAKEPILQEVHRQNIFVNKPLDYKGLMAFQFDYKETPRLLTVKPSLKNKVTGESYGSFKLSMSRPESSYQAGEYKLQLKDYYPDFALDEQGQPTTQSNDAKVPAFVFSITGPGLAPSGEIYLYFPRQVDKAAFRQDDINGAISKKLDISVESMNDVEIASYTSFLNIRVDRAMPYIWVGAAISMLGLVMGFYWQHRRIWLRIDGEILALGAHTNKNWFGIRNEAVKALNKLGVKVDAKSLETGGKSG
ncbi:MAG: cytochrome biosis protein ResB [Bacilli bacterium]|nr:cytochrome biosis protein ResB [Bacilli bacterium]